MVDIHVQVDTGGGGYIIWDRSGQEHTWWISMYRWRCTGGGGYILLIGFVADRFKPAIRFNLIHFSADRFKSAICLIH